MFFNINNLYVVLYDFVNKKVRFFKILHKNLNFKEVRVGLKLATFGVFASNFEIQSTPLKVFLF